jgi:hypothetical protein
MEEYFLPMNHRLEVDVIDTMDIGMGEDRAGELEMVEREPKDVVLMRHWTGEASLSYSIVEGACETDVLKKINPHL